MSKKDPAVRRNVEEKQLVLKVQHATGQPLCGEITSHLDKLRSLDVTLKEDRLLLSLADIPHIFDLI